MIPLSFNEKIDTSLKEVGKTIYELVQTHQAEVNALKEEIATLKLVQGALERIGQSESFERIQTAAYNEGLPVEAWMAEKLLEATNQHRKITIPAELFTQLARLASLRNISLDNLTNDRLFSQAIQSALDNRHL